MTSSQTPRILQQQPSDESHPEQSGEEMGEGSYEGSREYKKRTEDYLKKADVDADAEAAKPRSDQEARDMERAEDEGRSHSKGER